ncbi:CvpA family protein [Ruminococcaceae bacterium AM07-15]|nr:CvpA family protein [Ruminococcaceae bacterium AM07-15]
MKKSKYLRGEGLALLIALVVGFAVFYVFLPPISLQSREFYFFAILLMGVWFLARIPIVSSYVEEKGMQGRKKKLYSFFPLLIAALLAVLLVLFSVLSLKLFNASRYSSLLRVEEGNFTQDIPQITYDQIPMLDTESAQRLGDRKMGELAATNNEEQKSLVSQFEVSDDYIQINYQNRPMRVTQLEYASFFKWLTNRKEGLPGYIMIDMVTQETQLVRLEQGMKYSPSEYFGRNIERYMRFRYPTMLLGEPSLEVDDDGTPYFVAPRLKNKIGMLGGTDVVGAVFVNAVTGGHTYYDLADVPSWADHICPADLLVEQYDYYGAFNDGFFNAYIGQRGVTRTTEDYNYIAMNDDVFVYTGVTSVSSDQSNIGFLLCNQRTKEAKFYPVSGATEQSAQSSAQGAVEDLGYTATFPILLNINNQPTYFMSLKDSSGLVKMYAMVNVANYQRVAVGDTVAECEKKYTQTMQADSSYVPQETQQASGSIEEIRSAVVGGYTWYYFKIIGYPQYFAMSVEQNTSLPVLNTGDSVTITYDSQAVDGVAKALDVTRNPAS